MKWIKLLSLVCCSIMKICVVKLKRSVPLLMLLLASLCLFYIIILQMTLPSKDRSYSSLMFPKLLVSYFRNPIHVFLVMTSPSQTTLSLREACAVESAAFHHPWAQVALLTVAPLQSDNLTKVLLDKKNIAIGTMIVEDMLSGTPLELWYHQEKQKENRFMAAHLSDAVRLALLWKFGGLYLDTDVICLLSVHHLRNTIGQHSATEVNNAMMVFDAHHPYLFECMSVFRDEYNRQQLDAHGSLLLMRVINRKCNTTRNSIEENREVIKNCLDIDVVPQRAFYPIPASQWKRVFEPPPADELLESWTDTFAIHLWNDLSSNSTLLPGGGSIIDILAKTNCPSVYSTLR